mmetsp:Transcript_19623/g.61654  ORF Transcript_19623/g.61654 Transcript_19623/m.61654 type:complete len:232 (+) Transcript_19623:372-1067(+)
MASASAVALLTSASAWIFTASASACAFSRTESASACACVRRVFASISLLTRCAAAFASACAFSPSAFVWTLRASASACACCRRTSRSCCCVAIWVWPSRFASWDWVSAVLMAWPAMDWERAWSMILNCSIRMLVISRPYLAWKSSWSFARNRSWALSKKSGAEGCPVACASLTLLSCSFMDCADEFELCAISPSAVERMMLLSVATDVSLTSSGMNSRPTCMMACSGLLMR